MRVRLVFYGGLKREVGAHERELSLESEELTVARLMEVLARTYPQGRWSRVACAVGAQIVDRDYVIRDGDEVALLPPVSGG